MTENGCSRLNAETLFDILGKVIDTADAFGNYDDEVLLACFLSVENSGDNIALDVVLHLRHENRCRACGDTRLQSDVAAASAHYLNNRAAIMGLRGVADAVYHLQRGIHRGIKADSVLGARDIVVDRARNADAVDARSGERSRAAEGAVAADDNYAADALASAERRRSLLRFLLLELLASGGIELGSAVPDDFRYGTEVHLLDFALEQAVEAAVNTEHLHSLVDTCTDNRAECRVHARSVAAAG